ncbi:uncharacterized protein LOC122070196 isoform X2 [Macadamia integrifolia]|uniref:uncharacterized protein LOC122070196 isoform X2 n=1 Tax=Macadamia integrifolia TaxID=60698 RepID=UPI001C4EA9F4|nr:uncharacterized protein LOC122070196 isoform X2 [Macadamia integrifolia]
MSMSRWGIETVEREMEALSTKETKEMEALSSPFSPGVSPIELSDCIEELLRFTLSSYVNETLEFDLGLSKEYCTDLLKDDNADLNSDGSVTRTSPKSKTEWIDRWPYLNPNTTRDQQDTAGYVSLYPLYKSLASALCQFLTSGSFQRTCCGLIFQEDKSIKNQKIDEWNKLILDKFSELINEPFFSQLRAGQKTIEGRCAAGDYNRIGSGTMLLFNKCLLLEVKDVRRHDSFSEMLELESLPKVLPGVNSIEEGVQIYHKFYTEGKEKSNGVLAIHITKPTSQPYVSLASIISELSYDGIHSLLGLAYTAGSAPDALPPPRYALLSSFVMPHKPNDQWIE